MAAPYSKAYATSAPCPFTELWRNPAGSSTSQLACLAGD
jgi:hypothetical protein